MTLNKSILQFLSLVQVSWGLLHKMFVIIGFYVPFKFEAKALFRQVCQTNESQ